MTYTSYRLRLSSVITCSCLAYSYPHSVGTGLCETSLIDNPPKRRRSSRGLIVSLYRDLDILESALSGGRSDLAMGILKQLKARL